MMHTHENDTGWVLLRGLSRDQRHFHGFTEHFTRALGTRAVCIDFPGFGTEHARPSPTSIAAITDDARSRFAARGVERWSILGVSLGGMVALDWCARYPEDFVRCVAVNTSDRASNPLSRFRLRTLPPMLSATARGVLESRRGERSTERTVRAKERAVLEMTSSRPAPELEALADAHARWRLESPPHRSGIANQVRAAMAFRVSPRLETPLLVLTSRGDRLVSSRCSERIAREHGARIATHPSAGHDLPLDDPEWIAEQVRAWAGAEEAAEPSSRASSAYRSRRTTI